MASKIARWWPVTVLADARADGLPVTPISSFHPYEEQAGLVETYSAAYGTAEAARIVAPAGASEHQTGLARWLVRLRALAFALGGAEVFTDTHARGVELLEEYGR